MEGGDTLEGTAMFDAAAIFGSLVTNLQATISGMVPVILPILGLLTAFRVGKKLWNRFTA